MNNLHPCPPDSCSIRSCTIALGGILATSLRGATLCCEGQLLKRYKRWRQNVQGFLDFVIIFQSYYYIPLFMSFINISMSLGDLFQ
jgi:hypothetical protein